MTIKQHTHSEEKNKKLVRSKNHHDKFFKQFFSVPAFAKELVLLMFSKKELKHFDLSGLKVEKDSWINKIADLVVSLPLKGEPEKRFNLFIILEHKSKYDPLMWIQLFFYQAGLYDHTRKQCAHLMPIVVGVFYHGHQPWNGALGFQGGVWGDMLKKLGNMAQFVINYQIKLLSTHDLRQKKVMSDKNLKIRAVLNLMDKIWNLKNAPEELKKAVALFEELTEEREDVMLYVLEYLEAMQVVTAKSWRELEKELILEGTFKKGGVMDIREEIEERGRMKGRQEGRQESRQEVVLNMLKNRLDTSLISKVTGLSIDEIKKLKNGDN